MSFYQIIAAVIVLMVLCAGVFFSSLWLATLMAAAILGYGYLIYTLLRRPEPENNPEKAPSPVPAEQPQPAAPAITDETRRLIYEGKIAAISKFCSVVSHELRNPLASLKNIAYFLSKALKIEDERTKKMLDMMSGEIDKTNDMVSNLTDVSHLKRMNKLPSDVSALVMTALDGMKLKDIVRVERNLSPVSAPLDADKFTKVLHSIISNAVDALGDNGGQIALTLTKDEKTFTLAIQDNGTGMDKETLDQVFEPMFTTKTKVLGLGLTFSREVVTLHGGTLTLASEKGKGTTATIIMPL